MDLTVFLLTRSWRDTPQGLTLTLWGRSAEGPVRARFSDQEAVMFLRRDAPAERGRRKPLDMVDLHGNPVDALYFRSQRELGSERARLSEELCFPYESDIKPPDRFLMERFVTGACTLRGEPRRRHGFLELINPQVKAAELVPDLSVLAVDIETDGLEGPLLSIALASAGFERALIRGSGQDTDGLSFHSDERALLRAFVDLVTKLDPDVLTGWNVVEFDLRRLDERSRDLSVPLRIGRDRGVARLLEPRPNTSGYGSQLWLARVPGRVVLDGIATLRSASWTFESYALEDVAQFFLGRGKRIDAPDDGQDKVKEIRRMHAEDPAALAAYNIEDCRLVLDIFDKARLLGFAMERQRLTGLPMDRQGGAVAAFDYLYLPRLHRHGYVAPDVGLGNPRASAPGGYVMESKPGLYDNVLVLDFKSLYPSIIRTFCIDPLGLAVAGDEPVEGFDGARFSRETHILPGLIESLWQARDMAKKEQNAAQSHAIKILMNSFYGVLGTPACRFFDTRLVSSITRRGHQVLTESRDLLVEDGYEVLYGDTDSLFVLVGPGKSPEQCQRLGSEIAARLNSYWAEKIFERHRVGSQLELEFERHFLRFLMPTMRGSERGTKKRYAGTVLESDGELKVVVVGLEAVRTDWTQLARRFQRELFERVFKGEPYEAWARQTVDDLYAGGLDSELVYRKRLRRDVEDYRRSVPPHVQAARKLGRSVRLISYYITVAGPEPVALRSAALDYDHYFDKQLVPAADGLLKFLGTSLATVAGRQMSLF